MASEEYFVQGITALNKEKFLEAVDLLQQAVEAEPNFVDAWYHLGRAFFETHQELEAVNVWQRTLVLQPDHEEARRLIQYVQKYQQITGT